MNGRRMITATAVLAAVTAGGVAGAVIGVPGLLGASTPSTTTHKPDDGPDGHRHGLHGFFGPAIGADKGVLDAAAKALKLSTADLMTKLSDGKTTIADVAKQQNVDVNDVIKAMEDVANTDITNFVNNPLPAMPSFKGPKMPGGGPDFAGPLGGPGFGFRGLMGIDPFGAAAKALGITTQELMTDLGKGQSIADIAKAKNVNLDTLIGTLVSDAQSALDNAVKANELTKDQAAQLGTDLKNRITKLVEGQLPKGLGHFDFGVGRKDRHFGPFFGGPGGPGADGPPASTNAAPAV